MVYSANQILYSHVVSEEYYLHEKMHPCNFKQKQQESNLDIYTSPISLKHM